MTISVGSITTIHSGTDNDSCVTTLSDTANGTVVVSLTNTVAFQAFANTVSGTTITSGSLTSIRTTNDGGQVQGLDSTHFASIIRDAAGSNGVGNANSLSGTTITVGSVATFYSGSAPTPMHSASTDSTHGVVCYTKQGTSNQGWVKGYSVSGTTITYGSETQIATKLGDGVTIAFDSSTFGVFFSDQNSSSPVGKGSGTIGTISGTTPTLSNNSQTTFTTAAVAQIGGCKMTSTSGVLSYNDSTNSKGMVVAFTFSGTTITWGTPVQFLGFSTTRTSVIMQDSTNFTIIYTDSNDSSKVKAVQASLSGTTITVNSGTLTTISSAAGTSASNGNPLAGRLGSSNIFLAWIDNTDGNSGNVKGVILTVTNNLTISVTDSITLSESVTVTLVSIISVTDSITLAESVSRTLVSNISVTDSITITESRTVLNGFGISVSDSISIAESVTVQNTTLGPINVTDSITIAESITKLVQSFISVTDSITLSESVTLIPSLGINVSDAITIAESRSLMTILMISVTDAITAAESVTVYVVPQNTGIAFMRSNENDYPYGMDDLSIL